jgi:hypothetical protein
MIPEQEAAPVVVSLCRDRLLTAPDGNLSSEVSIFYLRKAIYYL